MNKAETKMGWNLVRVAGLVAGLVALFSLMAQSGRAEDPQIHELRQKILQLEKKTQELERLLGECMDSRQQGKPLGYGWQNKMNWRKLRVGMSQVQVRSILGEPTKVIQGVKTLWYYPNIYGGFVSFDQDGKIVGWNEP